MNKSTAEIRQAFLDFFHSKGHQIIASSSLVPNNDPTLLFTNAGMNQFKDVFLGLNSCAYSRVATSQRCVRAGGKHNDLDSVGFTARHHTFFEMLGNFSFGDYFKREAISYAWELLTGKAWFNLPKEKLLVTVYESDNEAFDIWKKYIGLPTERIIRIGDNKGADFLSDNFWHMGDTGPCGPCTEIFYDHGNYFSDGLQGSSALDNDRYIEIWNIVFIQFNRQSDGSMLSLPMLSVDTGMGLERITAVLQNVNSNYEIDLFRTLIATASSITGTTDLNNKSLRVIADHIRACTFLVSDGVIPSNEGRGYVLRRIIRRAIRHGRMLGVKNIFLYRLVSSVIVGMGSVANELKCQQSMVEKVLKIEEERFSRTLERGIALLDDKLNKIKSEILDGEIAFWLYDTFGFPVDLTYDICASRGYKVDVAGFKKAMELQRSRARKASVFKRDYNTVIRLNIGSQFIGYTHEKYQSNIIALFRDGQLVEQIQDGEEAVVVLDWTPFYSEAGGQIGDKGSLKSGSIDFIVLDTKKYGQCIAHVGKLLQGSMNVKESINAQIDIEHRKRICLNHSSTHLLHSALRRTLGDHVIQKGSLVNDKYLRFDFMHHEPMKLEQIRRVENLVNQQIRRNLQIEAGVMSIEKAKEKGAMALFGEKYDDHVRVLTIGDFSIELCGGTHATRTGDIGLFYILTESSSSSGIRRIEAVTGERAINKLHQQNDLLKDVENLLKSDRQSLVSNLRIKLDRACFLEKEFQKLIYQKISKEIESLSSQSEAINGVNLLVKELKNIEVKMLPMMIDSLKNKLGSSVIVLATTTDNKVNLIAGVSKDLTSYIKAGEIIRYAAKKVAGKGGGRADLAQAGGTNVSALPEAINSIEALIKAKLLI